MPIGLVVVLEWASWSGSGPRGPIGLVLEWASWVVVLEWPAGLVVVSKGILLHRKVKL